MLEVILALGVVALFVLGGLQRAGGKPAINTEWQRSSGASACLRYWWRQS